MPNTTLLDRAEPGHALLWRTFRQLLDRLVASSDREAFLNECLDALVELFGAARGLIVVATQGGGHFAINARGHGRTLTPREQEEVSRSIVREVFLTGRRTVRVPPVDAASGSASFDALGLTTAVAEPLKTVAWPAGAGDRPPVMGEAVRGVLYLDVRDPEKVIGELHHEFLRLASILVSIVLEQEQQLSRTREDLRLARARTSGPAAPGLWDLLAPRSLTALRQEVRACLDSDASILVQGESGSGKTLLAQAIAEASRRRPVVRTVLGSSDDLNTITSELFGHERGSFSGALTKRVGMVEFAAGGTLILDEVLNLPLHAQQLLLDFTQFGTYRPLGHAAVEPRHASVRIIASTNGDLERAVSEGRFRRDLYYRLATFNLRVPALRERREDIPALAEAILRRLDPAREWRTSVALRRLLVAPALPWPGNIRQLEAVMQRAVQRSLAADAGGTLLDSHHLRAGDLGIDSLPGDRAAEEEGTVGARAALDRLTIQESWRRLLSRRRELESRERNIICRSLEKHGGVVARAARELDVPRTSLVSRMQTLGIARSAL